jgi:hypothetical protein
MRPVACWPAASAAFDTPSAAAAWKTIPSWYVIGMKDQILAAARSVH